MKLIHSPLAIALMLAVGPSCAGEPPHPPATHAAHPASGDHDSTWSAPVPAVRWQADEPLTRGMQRVRAATQSLSHGAHGHLDRTQIIALAVELDAAVQAMFAECRLEPEPDAALHPLLARVLQSSARLASGDFDTQALDDLEAVLARYPLLFNDVGSSDPGDKR